MSLKKKRIFPKTIGLVVLSVVLAAAMSLSEPVRANSPDRPASTPIRLCAGRQHSALLLQDGTLYLWGDNTYGQLGAGDIDYLDEPRRADLPGKVMDVSLGSDHTLVLFADGSVYAMGRNTFGQLGNQSTAHASTPVKVEGLPAVTAVAAGGWHSLALGADGSIWGWGDNSDGQLGEPQGQAIRDVSNNIVGYRHISPKRLVMNKAVKIAAGGQFSLYIHQDGQLLAWGDNSRGQLGDGTSQARSRPTAVTGLQSVRDVSAGYQHVLAVAAENGQDVLYSWGDHSAGQLGLPEIAPGDSYLALPQRLDLPGSNGRIALISAGYAHSMAIIDVPARAGDRLLARQQVLAWGDNSYGQLSIAGPQLLAQPSPVTGQYHGFSGDDFSPFTAVACGSFHSLILSSKGLLAASGRGDRGQLGTQSALNRSQFTHVAIPDLIRPGWAESASLAATRLSGSKLELRWPQAQDNIRIAGYRLVLHWSDGTTYSADPGLGQHWVSVPGFTAGKDHLALHAGVYAYDAAGAELPVTELSRLLAFVPPQNDPGATLESYFTAPVLPAPLIGADSHQWRPNPHAPVRQPEVPWDLSAVYTRDEIPKPPGYSVLLGLAAAAVLLSLAVAFCQFAGTARRKQSRNRRPYIKPQINIQRIE